MSGGFDLGLNNMNNELNGNKSHLEKLLEDKERGLNKVQNWSEA